MKRKLIGLFMLVGLIYASTLFIRDVGAQNKNGANGKPGTSKMESDKATQAEAGAADTNVKTETATNSKTGQTAPAPPDKGGEKGKGLGPGHVEVVFNNYSPWYVQCFVDGNYRGTIALWGALNFSTGNGTTLLYARAVFDDGSSYRWGPRPFHYYSGYRYQWRLEP